MATGLTLQLPLPENSITSLGSNDPLALDFKNVFSFFDFLSNVKIRLNPNQYSPAYKNYINVWNDIKKSDSSYRKKIVREKYIDLLKDISLNYLTYEERRFLSLANFEDPSDLDIIIPLYSRKILEICKFYSDKREKLKYSNYKNQERGTRNSLENAVIENLADYVVSSDDENLAYNNLKNDIDNIISNLDIEIEDLYDLYTTYFDNDPNKSATDYATKTALRESLFSANQNSIDGNIFYDFDEATKKYIFYILDIYLKEIGSKILINYDLTQVNLNCQTGDKLYNLVSSYKDDAARILNLKSQLIKKYIGADFYYIKTGENTNTYEYNILFKADNPSGNLLNRHFPGTASVEEVSSLASLRKLGLFFKPEKTGLLYFSTPENKFIVDQTKLEPNKLYIFPDPNLYGNTTGLTNNFYKEYPLIHIQEYRKNIKNISDGLAQGDPRVNAYNQNFYAYFAKNQISFANSSYEKTFTFDFLAKVNQGKIKKWQDDYYGNQFALFIPTKFKTYKDSRTTSITPITSYEVYDGGPINFDDNKSLPISTLIFSSSNYYNILFEGGIGGIDDKGIMIFPSTTNPADFSYDYVLSSITYKLFDGGTFDQEEVYTEFDSLKNIYLNQNFAEYNTTTTTKYSITQNIIYIKNIYDQNIYNINDSFGDIYKKYISNTSLYNELTSSVNDFNLYNDVICLRTKNYSIFEKYKFDKNFTPITPYTNFLSSSNYNFERISKPFFFEFRDYGMVVKMSISAQGSFACKLVPEIYKIQYNDGLLEKLNIKFDSRINANNVLSNSLPVIFTRINDPILTYNSRNKLFAINVCVYDNNNIPYIFQIYFTYDDLNLTILNSKLICLLKEGSFRTINFIDSTYTNFLSVNKNSATIVSISALDRCIEFYG